MPEIENKEKGLFCPIMSKHSDMLEDCGKEKCAWWCQWNLECAIKNIGRLGET